MEFRQLGGSGFKVPALCLGTGTFGAKHDLIRAFGVVEVEEATELVSIALEAGLNMFDSADVYSNGFSEEILGKAIQRPPGSGHYFYQGHFPLRAWAE